MAQTADTFTAQSQIAGPANLPGGVSFVVIDFSFGGTASSFNLQSPFRNVISVHPVGAPMQITTGSTLDRIVLNNTLGSSGNYTLIAASTNGLDIMTPTILQFSRTGTNNQDVSVLIVSKGG